jgi:SOS-response transcriptional repressor LexA
MTGLTKRQQAILDFIRLFIERNRYAPTIREIGDRMKITSTNGVNDHLRALVRKGYLCREPNTSRTLTLPELAPVPTPSRLTTALLVIAERSRETLEAYEQYLDYCTEHEQKIYGINPLIHAAGNLRQALAEVDAEKETP